MIHPRLLNTRDLLAAVKLLEGVDVYPRLLTLWVNEGLVPVFDNPPGKRMTRLYLWRTLPRVRLIVRLRKHGFSGQKVRALLVQLDLMKPDVFADSFRGVLHIAPWKVTVQQPGEAAVELPGGQLRLPLPELHKGLVRAIEAVRRAA